MPIHSHCEFSLFDGFGHPEDHASAALEQGLPGLCVTDHRSVSGWYRWESAFKKAGVAPLFGIESYFSPNRHEKTKENIHLILIAKNERGLSSINRIATGAALEGNYANRHRCDWELLKDNSEGVICTTACVSGPVGHFLKESNDSEAKDRARDWLLKAQDIFGEDLYLELQPHPFDDQWALNEFLCDYSKVMGLKLLTSNDSHYPRSEDRPVHDVAVCISTKKSVNDKKRIRYEYDFSIKSLERLFDELQSLGKVSMGYASEAVENTRGLLSNVRLTLPKGLPLHPAFEDSHEAFRAAVNQGRRRRILGGKYPYGTDQQRAYDGRLKQEVDLLRAKNFDEYFLVTHDIVERARKAGVMVGPARGSVGGSIVAYVLGITEVDPMRFDLSFERFVSRNRGGYLMDLGYSSEDIIGLERLYRDSHVYEHYNKDLRRFLDDNRDKDRDLSIEWRVREELDHIGWQELEEFYMGLATTRQKINVDRYYVAYLLGITDKFDPDQMPPLAPDLPDIDLDFSDRASVVDLLRKRWGKDKVANIANYSELGIKDALERTSKAMSIPLPTGLKEEIHDHYASIADYLSFVEVEDPDLKKCLEYASRFEGCVHHLGRTAAGVIVSSVPVTDYVPMTRAENARVIAAYDKRDSEAIGFVKMDILEVSNLTILQLAQRIAQERGEDPPDPWEVPLDDRNALKVFERGDTDLIFQFGQRAMKNLLARMKPKTFEEVYAASALVRGGADDNVYIRRKNNPEEVEELERSLHPDVEEILRSSYYVLLYQEQAMRLCHEVGQMSYRNTNRVRKLAAKKEDTKELDTLGEVFISGAVNHGLKEEDAHDLWKSIRRQALYAFNKCITGDTRLQLCGSGSDSDGTVTVAELYHRLHSRLPKRRGRYGPGFNGPCTACGTHDTKYYRGYCGRCHAWYWKFSTRSKGLYALSCGEDGRIRKNRIRDVYYQGVRSVWRMTLDNGDWLDCTGNHRSLTTSGYKMVSQMSVGDEVIVKGEYEVRKYNPDEDRTTAGIRQRVGCVNGAYDKQNYGYVDGGFVKLSQFKIAHKGDPCEWCSNEHCRMEVAHLDGNRLNNDHNNLAMLCVGCHKAYDYRVNGRRKRGEKGYPTLTSSVLSIEYIGEQEVYDVEMEAPNHNFVVNGGIVTHNSHSVGYSMISMANAYYQVYHPLPWAIANLIVNGEDYEKRDPIIGFCRRAGIKMCEPSINKSETQWSYKDDRLFPGFTSIKGIGDSLANKIIEERDKNGFYMDGEDLLNRLKGKGFGPAKLKMLEAEGAVPDTPGDPLKLSIYRGEKLSLLEGMDLHPFYSILTVSDVRDFACSFVELYVTHCKKSGAVYNISYYSGDTSGIALSNVKLGAGSYIAILHRYGLDRIYAAVSLGDIDNPETSRKGYGGYRAFAKHPLDKEFCHRVLEIPPKRDLVSMVPHIDLDLKNQGLRPVSGLAYVLKTQKYRLRSSYTVNATPVFTRKGPRVLNMRSPIEKEGYYMIGYGYAEGERLDHKIWLAKPYEEILQPKLEGLDKEVG